MVITETGVERCSRAIRSTRRCSDDRSEPGMKKEKYGQTVPNECVIR
jgi:hypothetical protein